MPAGISRSTAPGSGHPDPTGERRFRIQLGSDPIGDFSECTGLSVEYEVFEIQEGGQNGFVHKRRGRAKYPNLVLKRGITHEDVLMRWFKECQEKTARREITLALIGPDAKPVRQWGLTRAFPVKWQGPNFNAGSSSVATETLEIVHEGFQAAGA